MIDREKYAADIMRDTHKLLMEALRQREQEILRFLAILGPAMAGYIWLVKAVYYCEINEDTFVIGTIAVILSLFIGAWYAITLGYNFRCIIFYLSRIENYRVFDQYIPAKWPRKLHQFIESSLKFGKFKFCDPPEIIKVFWLAFVSMISIICISVSAIDKISFHGKLIIVVIGFAAVIVSLIFIPKRYGKKLYDLYNTQRQMIPDDNDSKLESNSV